MRNGRPQHEDGIVVSGRGEGDRLLRRGEGGELPAEIGFEAASLPWATPTQAAVWPAGGV